jgi:periplasmic glucans biosynthesis protein
MSHAFRFPVLLSLLLALAAFPARAQEPFTFGSVETMAAKLAAEPYKEPASVQGDMRQLSYDHYRALRAKPDTALWRDGKSAFHVEFFPAGFIYEKPVEISVVEGDKATPVVISPDQFDFSDTGLKELPKQVALAGFRVTYPINKPDKFDEIIAFLGASYFRAIGRGQVYGASARGLAIDTAVGQPEQFPTFRAFWLVKPADGAGDLTVWALLDSPDATGAFSFVIHPGGRTTVDTHAVMYMRNDVQLLGIAPLTSMYFAGKASPPRDDYRPEIHDSDGLYMSTGAGERIWRPLSNPGALAISSFTDSNPKGFGLLQRERDFAQYQDSAANLQARPGLWIEPKDTWGDGEVRLVEIPSQSETNDNIVAFWVSRWPARKGERKEYNYLLSALDDEAALSPLGRVIATRAGAVPNAPKQRRIAVEFTGGELDGLAPEQPVDAAVSLTSGKVMRTYVEPLPSRHSWRLFIEFEPDGKKPADMRASLGLRGQTLTETWSFVWKP